MIRRAYFDSFEGRGWPRLDWLRPYFLGPPDRRWFESEGNDSATLSLEGLEGTEGLLLHEGRKDIQLGMWGRADLGVLLIYTKWGSGPRQDFSSKGNLSLLQQWVRSLHDTPLPVGLFIPFESAWEAVKEFIETDGELPTSIEWIANRDLPPNTFPDP